MNEDAANSAHWLAQPRWLKLVTYLIGIPSLVSSFFWPPAFFGIGAVALLQAAFIARAYWQHRI